MQRKMVVNVSLPPAQKNGHFFWPGTAVQRYRANFILEEAILFLQYRGTGVQATNVQNVAINTTSEK